MAQCLICSSRQKHEINKWLLNGMRISVVAKAMGLSYSSVKMHRQKHIPWRSSKRPKPVTTAEKFAELEYELARLKCLAEAGESVVGPLRVVYAQKSLLELAMRGEGKLNPSNKKSMLAVTPAGEHFEVTFENGRPTTKAIEKAS